MNHALLVKCCLISSLILSGISSLTQAQTDGDFPDGNTPDINQLVVDGIINSAIDIASQYFGVDKNMLTADTNLAEELFADTMDIYEIIDKLMELEYRQYREVPAGLLTIRQIADFVAHADYQVLRFEVRGANAPAPTQDEVYIQKIFFGTNRQPTGDSMSDAFFSGKRSSERTTSYGTCLISIPNNHAPGKLELPMNFGFYEQESNPKKHFILKELKSLKWNDFIDQINSDLKPLGSNNSTAEDVLIFIHGFNVPFKQAALRTGQIAFDLHFQGATILFSWPSRGGVLSYISDREAIEWSVTYIEKFLTDIIERTKAKRYHLIAHSMGNQGVIPALYQIALRGKYKDALFENIILAAPDYDARKFIEQIAPEVTSLSNRWTIYASEKDAALKASKLLRMDTSQRLGQPLSVFSGMDTVDASGFEVSPWNLAENHGYFSTKKRVIDDVRDVLEGLAPAARKLLSNKHQGKTYWQIHPM